MKSTISALQRDKGQYTTAHFTAIHDLGFIYFWSAVEGVLLYFGGDWVPYMKVREQVKELPEVTYAQ